MSKKISILKSENISLRSFSSSSLGRDAGKPVRGGSSNPKLLKERTHSFADTLHNMKGNSNNAGQTSSSATSSLVAIAKRDSDTKISFKLASENNLLLESSSFVKDLPMTESYQAMSKDIDSNEFKSDVISMARNAYDKASVSETKEAHLFFDFLTSHSLKILQFLSKAGVPVKEAKMEWKALTNTKSKDNLALAINVWATIQEKYMDFIIFRERNHSMLLEEFEDMEERNLLLQDFLTQKSSYSTSSTMEIQVKQFIKPPSLPKLPGPEETDVENLRAPSPPPPTGVVEPEQSAKLNAIQEMISVDVAEVDVTSTASKTEMQEVLAEIPAFLAKPKFKSRRSTMKTKVDAEVQTNPVPFSTDRPYVDLMDRATGPDREIPVYRGLGIQVDFRHPIEEKYEEIVVAYQFLEQEHAKVKIESATAVEELKSEFKSKIEVQSNDSQSEIVKLESIILELKEDNERLERDFLTATAISTKQQTELEVVKETMTKVTEKLVSVTLEEEFQRKARIETEAVLVKTKEDIVVISKTVNEALNEKVRLQSQKLELEEKQEAAQKKMEKMEVLLEKTEASYKEARTAELQLGAIKAELKKEQMHRAELVTLNDTLKAENATVKEIENRLTEKNSDLEKIIAKLMEFPDLSLGASFNLKAPPHTPEILSTLHHMIEHNNLRISLLEQRNNSFRDVLLDQAKEVGNEKYSNYHPVSSTTLIFNMNAIDLKKSRPTTADSSLTVTEPVPNTTYILGQSSRTRPVSAVSVRLIRPASGKNMIEQALQKPIFARLTNDGTSIEIDEGAKTKYPPTRFPFLAPSNPLSIYDSSLMEDAPTPTGINTTESTQVSRKKLRSALKGSRPPTTKSMPSSAVTFKWANEEHYFF